MYLAGNSLGIRQLRGFMFGFFRPGKVALLVLNQDLCFPGKTGLDEIDSRESEHGSAERWTDNPPFRVDQHLADAAKVGLALVPRVCHGPVAPQAMTHHPPRYPDKRRLEPVRV